MNRVARARVVVTFVAAVAVLAALVATNGSAGAQASPGGDRIVAASGQSNSNPDLYVEVLVAVPAGASASRVAEQALAAQDARPVSAHLGSEGFDLTGVNWTDEGGLEQEYIPGHPPGLLDPGGSEMKALQDQWSGVTPGFSITGQNQADADCGSLVKECDGPQVRDGENTIQWLALKGSRSTLGVAWSITGPDDEVDIALNTGFNWNRYANKAAIAKATALHEIGHSTGLGHSDNETAVMYRFIDTVSPTLTIQADDMEGIRYLYGPTITLTGVVKVDGNATNGATVSLGGTSFEATTPTQGSADGEFSIPLVPDGVTYDVIATFGDDTTSARVTVDGSGDLGTLEIETGGDSDGGDSPTNCKPGWVLTGKNGC